MIMSSDSSSPKTPKLPMAKSPKLSILTAGGAAVALLLFPALYYLLSPTPISFSNFSFQPNTHHNPHNAASADRRRADDPPAPTFYDDPSLSYSIDQPITGWDEKRRHWLLHHPSAAADDRERVLMVTGSQPSPCRNPVGDHLLLRFFKNKVDYCRIHGIEIFYNTALLHPLMPTFWAKIPLIRAAMVAHPEAEWIWWLDSDAAFTDMEFDLPLDRYRAHNLVVHGWPTLIYEKKSWVSLNAGVFLIRNCQWSLDLMAVWARMGPLSPEYEQWGKTLKSEFKDKVFPDSDDQSALVYLLLKQRERWADKVYFEYGYYFEGYWVEIVGRLANMTEWYLGMERRAAGLRRRRAEVVAGAYGRMREGRMAEEGGWRTGPEGWRRPFITHFTGCQPCSGNHNRMYSGENCWEGMQRALNFADDQVLRAYGFRHPGLLNSSDVRPLPFDFPAAADA